MKESARWSNGAEMHGWPTMGKLVEIPCHAPLVLEIVLRRLARMGSSAATAARSAEVS
jgi:hypothetical protein